MGVTFPLLSACFFPVPFPSVVWRLCYHSWVGAILPKHAVPRPGWERGGFVWTRHILISTPHTAAAARCLSGSSGTGFFCPALLLGAIPTLSPFVSKACAGNPHDGQLW